MKSLKQLLFLVDTVNQSTNEIKRKAIKLWWNRSTNSISSSVDLYNSCPISRTVIIKCHSLLLILHPTTPSQFHYFHQTRHPRSYPPPHRTIFHSLCRFAQKLETQRARSAFELPKFPTMTMTWNEKYFFSLVDGASAPVSKNRRANRIRNFIWFISILMMTMILVVVSP